MEEEEGGEKVVEQKIQRKRGVQGGQIIRLDFQRGI